MILAFKIPSSLSIIGLMLYTKNRAIIVTASTGIANLPSFIINLIFFLNISIIIIKTIRSIALVLEFGTKYINNATNIVNM